MQFRDLLHLTLTHSMALYHFLAFDSFVYKVFCRARSESENLENPLSVCFSLKAAWIDERPTPCPIPAGSSAMLNELFSVQNKPLDYHYSKSTAACYILKVRLFYRAVRIIINDTDWRAVRSRFLNAALRHAGASSFLIRH